VHNKNMDEERKEQNMSDNKEKRPAGSAGRPSGSSGKSGTGGAKSSAGKSNTSKSGAAKPASSKSASSKSGSRPASKGTSASTSAKGANSSKSSASAKSGGAKNSTAKKPAAKSGASSAAKTGGAKKNTAPSGAKKRSAEERPYNPRRDMQDERDLHNSPNAKRLADERRRRKYNKNRRLYNVLFYAAIAVAVISVVIILSVTVLFNISEITVERGKNVPYDDEQILAACGIEPGDNLFAIDTEKAALEVTTTLPYIEVCEISRKLPSKLELDVHAAVPLGRVTTTDGAYIVLSASGRALEYGDGYSGPAIAHISGMDATFGGIGSPVEMTDPDKLDVAAELVVGFGLFDLKLDSITFEQSGAVTAEYDGRIKIKFGVPTNLSQKVQVTASMITEGKIAKNESGILDLSINERAVFTPDYLMDDGE